MQQQTLTDDRYVDCAFKCDLLSSSFILTLSCLQSLTKAHLCWSGNINTYFYAYEFKAKSSSHKIGGKQEIP